MIEKLDGICETVTFQNDLKILLYNNDEAENYPPHWHIPYEIIMPLVNSYRVVCGGKSYSLRENDILLICPGIIHELFAPSSGLRMIFQASLAPFAINELETLSSVISPAILITPEACPLIHEEVHRLMLQIREEFSKSQPFSGTLIYSYFLKILAEVGRNHTEIIHQNFDTRDGKQKEYMEKFLFVTNYINEHFTEDLSLDKMASLAGFSKYHFTRLFSQYAGTTFYKFLNQKRIGYAKNLLLDPSISVTEAATHSGYTSLSAFLRMFRLNTGCTPTQFRKMHE